MLSNFVLDKDTEILEAMRIAGASRVFIRKYNANEASSSCSTEVNAKYKVAAVCEIDAKTKFSSSKMNSLKGDEVIEVKFKGTTNGLFAKYLFKNKSIWLKKDPKLSWLFESRFQPNQVTSFSWEVDYQEIDERKNSAEVAVACGVSGYGEASTSVKRDDDSAKMNHSKKIFIAEFG